MAIYALGDLVPTIDPDAYVHPEATLIGDVRLGAESSVWPNAVLRGEPSYIVVGARTSVQDCTVIHCQSEMPTIIGERCIIGHLVHLEGCTIEDRVLIGSNSVVLEGAIVRTGAVVGASAVVPAGMEVPTGAMALGVPARLRLDAVPPGTVDAGVAAYRQRAARFRAELRKL
jgi:carbonic anhydrase/acetyltransferase-like protein (isoleucine patch superfamily)